jgi:hypothetical protein
VSIAALTTLGLGSWGSIEYLLTEGLDTGYVPPGPPGALVPGGSSRRRGAIWEPRVDLVIEAARQERELESLAAQETELRARLKPSKTLTLKGVGVVQTQAIMASLERVLNARETGRQQLEATRATQRQEQEEMEGVMALMQILARIDDE